MLLIEYTNLFGLSLISVRPPVEQAFMKVVGAKTDSFESVLQDVNVFVDEQPRIILATWDYDDHIPKCPSGVP